MKSEKFEKKTRKKNKSKSSKDPSFRFHDDDLKALKLLIVKMTSDQEAEPHLTPNHTSHSTQLKILNDLLQ